jgi:hypothetical protein
MSSRRSVDEAGAETMLVLTLYVAGDNTFSRQARANLSSIVTGAALGATIRLVDVLQHPEATLEHRIFVTPALVATTGGHAPMMIVGDLSDHDRVLRLLRSLAVGVRAS